MKPAGSGRLPVLLYTLLMLGCGFWQLADWYFGSEDPIWHLFFYFLIMPALSLVFGFVTGESSLWFLSPLYAFVLTWAVYFFLANGGLRLTAEEASGGVSLGILPAAAAAAGILSRKILALSEKKARARRKPTE